MLPIKTLKLIRDKTRKQLDKRNMVYREAWSEKEWGRKFEKRVRLKRHFYIIEALIKGYPIYQLIATDNNWNQEDIYNYINETLLVRVYMRRIEIIKGRD